MTQPQKSDFATRFRSHTCGELRASHVRAPEARPPRPPIGDDLDVVLPRGPARAGVDAITLSGHVDQRIDDSTVVLRDRYGKTLVRADPAALPYVPFRFGKLNLEDVVQVSGEVALREKKDEANPTGEVYLRVQKIEVLSASAPLPRDVLTAAEVQQDDKLAFRQLYLRRKEVQDRLEFRSRVIHEAREFFLSNGFLEMQTPQLFWYDPVAIGGEVVPNGGGKAWRLSSGPVVLNQYIIAGQFERTFQFTRITRREPHPGPLHQQEHTGLDMNMSYVDAPDFQRMVERLLKQVFKATLNVELETPFARFSFEEATLKFGHDKPDLRYGMEMVELPGATAGLSVRAFRAFGARDKLSDADVGELFAGAAGLSFARVSEGKIEGTAAALFREKPDLLKLVKGAPGDIIVISAGKSPEAAAAIGGEQRAKFAKKLGLIDPRKFVPCWVDEYPFLEDDKGNPVPRVVVFSRPIDADYDLVVQLPQRTKIRARAWDLVLNGMEIASAYIGNHSLMEQRLIWNMVFLIEREDLYRLRAPIEAHRFGVPPHGGMNIGFDRLLTQMLGLDAIDEVMAFPKTTDCRDLLTEAPGAVAASAVQDLVQDFAKPDYGLPQLTQESTGL